jgi:hypothetical protein
VSFSTELAALFRRELTRLSQELHAFPDDETLWKTAPGVSNSAGNLTLHLEGNLREYIGRQLGGLEYRRERDREFSQTGVPADLLKARIASLAEEIPAIVSRLTEADLEAIYPEHVFGSPLSTRQLLLSVYGHLGYHLGQIDYLRRVVTGHGAIALAALQP